MEKLHIEDYYKKTLAGKDLSIPEGKSYKLIKSKNAGSREELIALSEDKKKISYGEMFENWDKTARVFSALGINSQNNSRVLTLMPNVATTCYVDYALNMTGGVVDFIDPTTRLDIIKKYIENEKITDIFILDLLMIQSGMDKQVERLKEEYGLRNIIVCHDKFMTSLMPFPVKTFSLVKNTFDRFDKRIIRFEDAIRDSRYTPITYDNGSDTNPSIITHTSGTTTGVGKPIPLTDRNRKALNKNYELGQFAAEPGMKMLHFIPYFAGYGSINTADFSLNNGFELQQVPLFTIEDFGVYLEKCKPNIVFATPSCWLNLVRNPRFRNIDLSFLKYASSGGGPLSIEDEELINDFLEKHGAPCKLTKGYGLSEVGGCCIFTLDKYNEVGSLGVRHPLNDIILRNPKTKEIYPATYVGEGEALINSETVTSGVLDGKVIVPLEIINGKPYLATKDVLRREEDGHYEYVERIDRMFPRYDGYNVYPLYVENLMETCKEIERCAIVPLFDEKKNGMVPKVYIKLAGVEIEDKVDFINQLIHKLFLSTKQTGENVYKANYRDIPRSFVFVDRIPKNTMDKDDYHLLKQGIPGEEYEAIIEEDNMGVSSISIQKKEKDFQKVIKK